MIHDEALSLWQLDCFCTWITSLPEWLRDIAIIFACLYVGIPECMSVSLPASITQNQMSKLYQIFGAYVARSTSNGVAMRCVFPVLWITSCLHTVARPSRREKGVCWKWLTNPRPRIRRNTQWLIRAASGQSLISTIAFLCLLQSPVSSSSMHQLTLALCFVSA